MDELDKKIESKFNENKNVPLKFTQEYKVHYIRRQKQKIK